MSFTYSSYKTIKPKYISKLNINKEQANQIQINSLMREMNLALLKLNCHSQQGHSSDSGSNSF